MKTILYLSKFKKVASEEYKNSIDITPDEIVIWDGDNSKIPCEISVFPCLLIDPEGAVEELNYIDPNTQEKIFYDEKLRPEVLEHRKGEIKIKTKKAEMQARVKNTNH